MRAQKDNSREGAGAGSAPYEGLLYHAMSCLKEGRLEPARVALQRAIGMDPERAEAFNLLGGVAELAGRHDQAERYFRAALALDPCCEAARRNLNRTGPSADLALGLAADEPASLSTLEQEGFTRLLESAGTEGERPRGSQRSLVDAGHGPHPYRSPARSGSRPASRSWRARLRAVAAIVLLVLAAVGAVGYRVWSEGAEARAVARLPPAERIRLYTRTLSNLKVCRDHGREDALRAYCEKEAALALAFPECGAECRTLARLPWAGPRR